MKKFQNSVVYAKELEADYLAELYYLVSWNDYFKKKNTWNPTLII